MERTKVKNLARQIRGVSYKPEDLHDSLDDTAVILLRANNIDEGKINFDDVVYVDKSKVSNEQYLKVGDVLICASSGSKQLVGKAASVDFDTPCTFGAFCKVVRPNNDVADYLGKYFQSGVYRRKISEVAIGANINNIRNEHIDSLDIPIYESDQVRGIVEKIGLLQNIIDNRKCELSKLDELIKARFVEMFGKEEHRKKLIKLCKFINGDRGKNYPSGTDIVDSGVPFINAGHLEGNKIDFSNMNYITEEKYQMLNSGKIQLDDILYCLRGSLGKKAIVEFEMGAIASSLVILRSFGDIEPIFLLYSLEQPYILEQMNKANNGSSQPNLSAQSVKDYEVILPSREKQLEFADFVKQVDKSKVVVQKALDEAQILFDSLMQEYFG